MSPKRPSDLQYQDTAAYVGRFAPQARARILDVGCGSGGLAAALGAAGHVVTPIDASEEAVAEARANGIDARQADLLDFTGGPFDVVLFSFSLHHIAPLGEALEKARALLAPGGRVMLEEFAIERVDAATAAWFFGTQDVLVAAGLLGDAEPSGVLEGNQPERKEPLARWRERFEPGRHGHGHGHGGHGHEGHGHGEHSHAGHGHEGHGHFSEQLHEGDAMRAGVAAAFRILHEEPTPALARFWLHRLRADALPVARQLVPLERLLIAQGVIRPFGFRIVAGQR
ncbi:MAG: class I SAM-dependent methyltransferase [Candidatus Lambdaproteobacteria bacterium]|nr:class I SAM-dependent methyltransferase [Candidatus Lambdaproteobacteria bacterium]